MTNPEWAMKPFNKQDDLIYYLTSECEKCDLKREKKKPADRASRERRKRRGGGGGGDSGSSPEKKAKTAPQGRSATGGRVYDPTKAGA